MHDRPVYKGSRRQPGSLSGLVEAFFFLLVWQILAAIVQQKVLLPSPLAVLKALGDLVVQNRFWQSVLGSVIAICGGFLTGLALALGLGHFSFFVPLSEPFIRPLIAIVKSAPIAALTIILMIWIDPDVLPFVLVLMAIVPPLYSATLAGLQEASPELLEMAFVYRFRPSDTYRAIYLPSLLRQLMPSLEYTSGLAWKAGITGEIMAQPFARLGTGLYNAKIQLLSAEVLAYLAVILCLSYLLAKAVAATSKRPLRFRRKPRKVGDGSPVKVPQASSIHVQKLWKAYGENQVLEDLDMSIEAGQMVVISGASGEGKSTFFRVLSGLLAADQGTLGFGEEPLFSYAFQDGRLLEDFTLKENLLFAASSRISDESSFLAYWEPIIAKLGLPPNQALRTYSGGMKQRASLLRALATPSAIVILDEVFREVDTQTEKQMLQLLVNEKGSRTTLIATHRPDLAEDLADTVIYVANL